MRGGFLVVALTLASLLLACGDDPIVPERPHSTPPSDTENVYIVISDDVILNGRLFGAENDPLVILTHMQPNDQTAWFDFARELADEGYAALTFDFRGYGDSSGSQDFDRLDDDLSAVIDYMRDRGREEIVLLGASMGATASLVVAQDEQVTGVVALSPPARFEGQDAVEATSALTLPTLILASEEDAPTLLLDDIREAASASVASELVPGTAHGTDLLLPALNDQAGVIRERILEFLEERFG
jgi:pimeloyl-ACP methyl ester carboxylesterase